MRSENINEIQRKDKVALKKFVVIIFISMIVGALIGASTQLLKENLADVIANSIYSVTTFYAPYANIILFIVSSIVIYCFYEKSRKLYTIWDGENEEQLEKIELSLSYALSVTSLMTVLSFFFFALGYEYIISMEYSVPGMTLVLWLASFILVMIGVVIAQQKIVNFLKEINPEKEGSVFELKFAKKWEESCDEAQKLGIYKSAYKAYRNTNMACITLWFLCVLGAGIWNFGVLPVTMVTIVWVVLTTSYCLESIRLDRKKNK